MSEPSTPSCRMIKAFRGADTPQVVVPAITLRPDAAAAALGVSRRQLDLWVEAGSIPSFKIGRIRLFSIEALQQWARDQMTAGGNSEVFHE